MDPSIPKYSDLGRWSARRRADSIWPIYDLIGGGENVARNSGISIKRYKVYAFTLSGLVAGLGGLLAVARLGAAGCQP